MTDLHLISDHALALGNTTYPCAIGAAGRTANKQEGDQATPIGIWPLRQLLYRSDRLSRPKTRLPAAELGPDDGWCDAPGNASYNRPVQFPFSDSAEHLWREDHVYDLIVILGYNDDPVIPGKGSAIFLHLAKPDYAPTEGCVAVAPNHMVEILALCGPETSLHVHPH